jgi:hypothetical protein
MQRDIEQLRRELTDIADALADDSPEAGRAIEAALTELDDSRVGERLAASAEAFDLGQPLYVIGSEQIVESALERLGRRLVQA